VCLLGFFGSAAAAGLAVYEFIIVDEVNLEAPIVSGRARTPVDSPDRDIIRLFPACASPIRFS